VAAIFVVAIDSARAEDYQARSWAASCAACHGTNGRGGYGVPALAGRSQADLAAVLKEFKHDQRRTATIMHQFAKGYTDAQIERIADYFSRQSR
jgi:cytochrome c553